MKLWRWRRESITAYVFLSPVLLFYAIFLVIPVVFSLIISFTEWGGFDLESMQWVGMKNYEKIFAEGSNFFHPILTNTFTYAFCTVAISFVCALFVSFVISRLRFEGFWRTLYFLPSVTTIVAIGNIWLYMYDPQNGLINGIISSLGLQPVNFLDNPNLSLASLIVVGGWLGIGGSTLILSAGLKGIPNDYYEAASIEGAGAWKQYIHITYPLLRPTILFVLITSFIGGLQSFTLTLVMTNGGPVDSSNVAALEMYNQAFQFGNWGLASAQAFILFICILIVTLVQLAFFRKGGVESY